MSILARSTLRVARHLQAPRQVRGVHIENTVDHTLPTDLTNKTALAAKMIVFSVVSFGIPFFGAWFQLQVLRKAAA
nr:cytochrome c oxidase subunit 7c [Cryptococcus depauperatus CBS 7841]